MADEKDSRGDREGKRLEELMYVVECQCLGCVGEVSDPGVNDEVNLPYFDRPCDAYKLYGHETVLV